MGEVLPKGASLPHRGHVVAAAGEAAAFGACHLLRLAGVVLREAGVEEADHGNVQAIEPHHRRVGFVAVVVPGPARRDDEVARPHGRALAVHRGVGAGAFDDEAQRALRVAVAGRHLAGKDQLQAGVERLRDRRLAAQLRVLQDQDAAHRLLRRDRLAGAHQEGADLVVLPEGRHAGRVGLRRHQRMQHFPQRGEVVRLHVAVQLLAQLRGRVGCVHRGLLLPAAAQVGPLVFEPGLQGRRPRPPRRCRFSARSAAVPAAWPITKHAPVTRAPTAPRAHGRRSGRPPTGCPGSQALPRFACPEALAAAGLAPAAARSCGRAGG